MGGFTEHQNSIRWLTFTDYYTIKISAYFVCIQIMNSHNLFTSRPSLKINILVSTLKTADILRKHLFGNVGINLLREYHKIMNNIHIKYTSRAYMMHCKTSIWTNLIIKCCLNIGNNCKMFGNKYITKFEVCGIE